MTNPESIRFKYSVAYTLSFVFLLWVIKGLEWALSFDFGIFGIHPRTLSGTFGIITGPLVHGDYMHLISNSFPLILLGIGIFYFYDKIAVEVFFWIYFVTGVCVWAMARDAYHIGASGIVYGLVAFMLFSGLFRRDTASIAIALIVVFLYGGMFYGLIPSDPQISWESHLMGSFTGLFCAFYFRNSPLPGDKPLPDSHEEDPYLEELDAFENQAPDPRATWSDTSDKRGIKFTYTYVENVKKVESDLQNSSKETGSA